MTTRAQQLEIHGGFQHLLGRPHGYICIDTHFLVLSNVKAWLEEELRVIAEGHVWPDTKDNFLKWMERVMREHPAPRHALYKYLERYGTLEDIRHFLLQESLVDKPFADFIALCQVGSRGAMKMELAVNYWDEMGRGNPTLEHAYMFECASKSVGVVGYDDEEFLFSALETGNLLWALTYFKEYSLLGIGALSATEDAVSWRFQCILNAAERLGLSDEFKRYYLAHIEGDALHSKNWLDHVIKPLLEQGEAYIRQIAMGVVLRLESSKRYCDELYTIYTRDRAD